MAYHIMKVARNVERYATCSECSADELKTYFRSAINLLGGLLWQRIYCSGCVKELDTVYNYYIEIHHDVGLTYTFYDLESLHWYFPSLVPSLTKI